MPDLYTCTICRQVTIAPELVEETPRGGVYTVPARCATCRAVDREPQGEAMALFTPAPAPMPGQTTFSAAAAREGRDMNSDEQRADRAARIEYGRLARSV